LGKRELSVRNPGFPPMLAIRRSGAESRAGPVTLDTRFVLADLCTERDVPTADFLVRYNIERTAVAARMDGE